MNYILQINHFWNVFKEYSFSGNATKMYFYILNISNSLNWKNPFRHSLSQFEGGAGMAKGSVKSSLKKLEEAGLIEVKFGKQGNAHNHNNKSQIYIVPVSKFDSHSNSQADSKTNTLSNIQPDTKGYSQADRVNKRNKENTKTNKDLLRLGQIKEVNEVEQQRKIDHANF